MSDERFRLTVPAEARFLKAIRAFFQPILEIGFGEQAGMLILALDEACSNVVKHRSGSLAEGLIHVRASMEPDRFRLEIGDFCGAEDIPNIKPRDLADVKPGGLGTHFIAEIMDSVTFQPEPDSPGRMALVLEKQIPACGADKADEGTATHGD